MRRLGKVRAGGISGPEPRPIPSSSGSARLPLGRLKRARHAPTLGDLLPQHRIDLAEHLRHFPLQPLPQCRIGGQLFRQCAQPLARHPPEVLKLGNRVIDVYQPAPVLVGHHAACPLVLVSACTRLQLARLPFRRVA